MEQIWKDKVFSAATDTLPIEISVDGETIYKGTLSSFPGSTEVKTQLNRLCESFLSINFPETTGVTAHPEALRTFIVSDNSGNTLTSVDFIYDWGYEDFKPVLSDPVNGHLDSRMRVPYTMYLDEEGYVDYYISEFLPETGDPKTYIGEIQIPGSEVFQSLASIHNFRDYSNVSSMTCTIDSDYLRVTNTDSRWFNHADFRLIDTSRPSPMGQHGIIGIYYDGAFFSNIQYRVSSEYQEGTDSVTSVTDYRTYENVSILPVEEPGWTFRLESNGDVTFKSWIDTPLSLHFGLLLADGIELESPFYTACSRGDNGIDFMLHKSAKHNCIRIISKGTSNFSIRLNTPGYCCYEIAKDSASGLTDLYIADTVEWFNSLPTKSDGFGTFFNNKSKRFAGVSSDSITVHCTDGTIIWTPN